MYKPAWLTNMEDIPDEYKKQLEVLKIMMSLDDTEEDECIQMMDYLCLLYTSPSPRDRSSSRMPSSA